MWGHMFFVSSILVGKDFMWTVAERSRAISSSARPYPGIVSVIVFGIVLLVVHARVLAMRKFPANYRAIPPVPRPQARAPARRHHAVVCAGRDRFRAVLPCARAPLSDADAVRIASVRMSRPIACGASSWWPLYLVLLFTVEVHGTVGLYRLCVKWGWPAGKDAERDATQAAQVGQVDHHGVLSRARPRDARGVHQDRLSSIETRLRRALHAGVDRHRRTPP